ncbi:MAG: hypothetical protein IH988_04165, partial [Planctomycetes bacterium]|nr:hypothetical protein [Planctomycetota bacterium]
MLINNTVTGNAATSNSVSEGGGIYNSGGAVNLTNTIVALNTTATSDPDVSGPFTSQGNNLIGDGTGSTGFTDGVNSDQVGTGGSPINPLLGPLQDNGGSTSTHALLTGSPAIDAGNNTGVPATDQRGFARIVDGDLDGTATIDIGAFEFLPPVIPIQIDIKPGSDPNSINAASQGLIPVAILSTASFDATTVDGTTVQFGPAGAPAAHDQTDPPNLADHQRDVDGDGLTDYVLHFLTGLTGISEGDTEACLGGQTFGGIAIAGCDAVRIVPPWLDSD